ncbi:MAG: DNA-binding response regulator [Clostridiales bacterium 38-18]|nr:MAG: DNA-binding response regulator [Clostridiales bacterium 38-18]
MSDSNKPQIKVLIADDHDLIRQGLKTIISYEPDLLVAGEARDGYEVLSLIGQYHPDVLLMDINMPGKNGIEVLKEIKGKHSTIKVVLLTVESDRRTILDAIEIGADGYVLKGSSTTELLEAIRCVYEDENYIDKSLVTLLFKKVSSSASQLKVISELSARDLEILTYLSKGMSNREIADTMYLSEKTIKNNMTRIFRIIDVRDRVQATLFALENQIENLYSKTHLE